MPRNFPPDPTPAISTATNSTTSPSDPNEQHNLANDPKYAAHLKAMQTALKEQLATLPGGFGDLKPN
jgi:hypothetical protein